MPPIAILIALADPTRCRIIEILRDGPQPVHILAASFKISRPAISRHLRVLKQARLISEKKSGRENRYALHPEKLKPVGEWVAQMRAESGVGQVVKKPAEKPPATIIVYAQPELLQETAPVPEVVKTVAIAKPKREAAISQMGFDF